MDDALVFAAEPKTDWVGYLNGRKQATQQHPSNRRLSDSQDIIVDKAGLASEVKALLSSVGVALARLDHKKHSSKRRQEYMMVQGDAERVLSALTEPGSGHQLEALISQQSAIRGLFTMEESRSHHKKKSAAPDDDDDDDDNAPTVWPTAKTDNTSDTDDSILSIFKRRGRFHKALHHHVAIRHDAAAIADDSKTDLLAAVAVAGLIYEGASHKEQLEDYLAKARVSMEETEKRSGASGTGATVDQRLDMIVQEGKNIAETMGKDGAQTNAGVVNAAENIADLHLGMHKADGTVELAQAKRVLVDNKDQKLLADFEKHEAGWNRKIDETAADLHAAIKDARASADPSPGAPVTSEEGLLKLLSQTRLDGVFAGLNQDLAESNTHLISQSTILERREKALTVAEAHLHDMMRGEYKAGDAAAIAQEAGTSKEAIYKEVASHQETHAIPEESTEQLNDRIRLINASMKAMQAPQMASGFNRFT